MRLGAFDIVEPLPELQEPHAFVMLSPWIDVGKVGSSTLTQLEAHFASQEVGRLRRPGMFYDFTRYRPTVYMSGGQRHMEVPNTVVNYAQRKEGNDFLLFHCLEPHAMGETYVDSILRVLTEFKVKRYCMLGAMYDAVPHTRPLVVSGSSSNKEMAEKLSSLNINQGTYQGPTSISVLISMRALQQGLETMTLLVHLPHYVQLEEDYQGQYVLLSLLSYLYQFPMDLSRAKRRGEEQYRQIGLAIEHNPRVHEIVKAMETSYDARLGGKAEGETSPLSPEVEKFLRDINQGPGPIQSP